MISHGESGIQISRHGYGQMKLQKLNKRKYENHIGAYDIGYIQDEKKADTSFPAKNLSDQSNVYFLDCF